ncbi:MAG: pyrimidine-nucleoside phosphorylase [Halanaerobiaceae bacterium]
MRPYDIIYKKREGKSLNKDEIEFLIDGYTKEEIPDYQLSAWAMAVFFKGMNSGETADLTMAMVKSGDTVDLSSIKGVKVDKHSSGGVGDTTTMVLAPLVAAAGIPVAKLSGRGLGHTGGTIDKLESIPGFTTELSLDRFIKNVRDIGVAVAGQTANLTPADKKLYALRDVTATVDSIPLIASSIMSKKIAGGADGIVLDVKVGDGAFMERLDDARSLARAMVNIGDELNRKTIAVITDMNQPLGYAIGNTLEVKEAIATLKGEGPEDLTELCLTLAANMLLIAGRIDSFEIAYDLLKELIKNGDALEKFREFVESQGGNGKIINEPDLLGNSTYSIAVKAEKEGTVEKIETKRLGVLAVEVGAGRSKKGEEIDSTVGIVLNKKIGDKVEKDELLAQIYFNEESLKDYLVEEMHKSYKISRKSVEKKTLIYEIVD